MRRRTASYAHSKGLLCALKNTGDLVVELATTHDFAIVEQCAQCVPRPPFVFVIAPSLHCHHHDVITYHSAPPLTRYGDCDAYSPFFELGKPIFGIEYALSPTQCARAADAHVQMKVCEGRPSDGVCQGHPIVNCYSNPTWVAEAPTPSSVAAERPCHESASAWAACVLMFRLWLARYYAV